jgi:putative selenium metabolism hydrolase
MASAPPDLERCVALLQRMIQTVSLPGREEALARLLHDEMQALGYDHVRIDEVGNVIGLVRGRGEAPGLMLNTHLDHVDVGEHAAWPHPPYGGLVQDGIVHGRGAVDIKGPAAAQILAGARLAVERPPGDVLVSCVVQEEIGGVGARHLARELPCRLVVVGEPSSNQIRRGNRGRTELLLRVRGRSVHASVPELGRNPLFALARFLCRLETIVHPEHPDLGPSTVAPTLLHTDQTSANVIPGEVCQVLDWRNIPGQSDQDARQAILDLARAVVGGHPPGITIDVDVPRYAYRTWTGRSGELAANNPAYALAESHPAIEAARALVEEQTEAPCPVGCWRFATDGGHFAAAGAAVVGFGPGDELLAHTVDERVEVAALADAIAVYERFGRELSLRTAV